MIHIPDLHVAEKSKNVISELYEEPDINAMLCKLYISDPQHSLSANPEPDVTFLKMQNLAH